MQLFSISESIVLVIDDTSMMRANHKKVLQEMGVSEKNMVFARDGAQGLSELANLLKTRGQVDLIVCDWDMPKVNGIQVLEMIKKVPASKNIPFAMVTGHTQKNDIVSAMQKGVDCYIMKPFKEDHFKSKILDGLITGFVRS